MRAGPLRLQTFLLVVLVVLAAVWAYLPSEGYPRVVDGDTLVMNGKSIRLHGIDAPEREQVCFRADASPYFCGRTAADRLRQEISGAKVECVGRQHDAYRRQVATCTVNGKDLGDAMVRSGWALDMPQYSGGRYLAAEIEARAAKRGLWAGEFEAPWRWRQQHSQHAGR
jgi:endonuclease YncB( thermonuclease family)